MRRWRCRWCGVTGPGGRAAKREHRCVEGACEAYRALLHDQIEDMARWLGQHYCIADGPGKRQFMALRRRALAAQCNDIGGATARGWKRYIEDNTKSANAHMAAIGPKRIKKHVG